MLSLITQSYLTLCYPMDISPPGSSVHGVLQARILEWVVISFSRGSSQSRDRTQVACFGHLVWGTDSLEKTLMLGKTEGRRRKGWQRMRRLDSITNSMDMSLGKLGELVMVTKSRTRLSNWTELNHLPKLLPSNTITIGVGISTQVLWREHTHSV